MEKFYHGSYVNLEDFYAFSKLLGADDFLGFVCQTADIPVRLRHFHAIVEPLECKNL